MRHCGTTMTRAVLWCLIVILLLVVLFIAVSRVLLFIVNIKSTSMSPTLIDGDQILAVKYWPKIFLRKNLIVIVELPFSTGEVENHLVIKRIIGTYKDVIRMDWADILMEHRPQEQMHYHDTGVKTCTIPQGYIFVLGDNLISSSDSRIWGPLSTELVKGVMVAVLPRKRTSGLKTKGI